MKYIKSYILSVLMVFAVTGCTLDDLQDDVNDLKDRVALIEQQVKLLNDNLAVVGYILDAQHKTVSKVETVTEGGKETQHVITLSDGTKLTLTIGAPGTVNEPVITVGEDKMWYINGVSTGKVAVGEPGKNGEGFPEFRVEGGNWQVRFGNGSWSLVPGGAGVAEGSLGDQIFESATVSADGKNFVVTLKNGDVHTLPVVATLVCAIDRSGLTVDADGFLVIEKDQRVMIPVTIKGENPVVTYPQGWRAELNKLENADEKGNNYQLLIYSPAAKQSLTRASADNASDVTVQVQEGVFWAVDKIKVKNPKDYSNNFVKYEDGLAVVVGGLEITLDEYGTAQEITGDKAITEGGVYFVSTNNVTLTYNLGTTGVDNLIIIPTTSDVTTINLTVNNQIYFKGTVACQNMTFTSGISDFPLRVNSAVANIVFDKCKINGLTASKGLATPNTANTHKLNYFEITETDIKIEKEGNNLHLINLMDCNQLAFVNNLVYYSGDVPSTHLANVKVFNGQTFSITEKLIFNSNTFVDVKPSSTSSNTGFIYASRIGSLDINNNICWLTEPLNASVIVRIPQKEVGTGDANYGYSGGNKNLQLFFGSFRPDGIPELEKISGLFDTTNPATFNKATGVFTPKEGYTQYGAQR